jgi:hypothetical protein
MAHPPVSQFGKYYETPESLARLGVSWTFANSTVTMQPPTEDILVERNKVHDGWLTRENLLETKQDIDNLFLRTNAYLLTGIQKNPYLGPLIQKISLPKRPELIGGCVLNWLLQPSEHLRRAIAPSLTSLRCKSCVFVAIHIRVGGAGGSGSARWVDPSRVPANRTGDFFHCAEVIEQTLAKRTDLADGKRVKWFVTSDSDQALEEGLLRGGARTVENKGELVHVDRSSSVTDIGLQRMYGDFELLTEADILIGSPSGFSEFASQLSFRPRLTWPQFTRNDYAQCASAALRL